MAKYPFPGKNKNEKIFQIVKAEINTEEINQKPISKDCKDLLLKMLTKNPEKRIKMIDVLKHPWFLSSIQNLNVNVESIKTQSL